MATSKTKAAVVNISIQRGTSLYRQIIIKSVVVPEGTTFHLHLLSDINSTTVLKELGSVSLVSTLGTSFSLELAAADTLVGVLPNDVYFYKVEAILPSAAVVRMLQGNLVLTP